MAEQIKTWNKKNILKIKSDRVQYKKNTWNKTRPLPYNNRRTANRAYERPGLSCATL